MSSDATNRVGVLADHLRSSPRAQMLTPTLGAEVTGVDLSKPVDSATIAELDRLLLKYKVLMLRDQRRVGAEEQLRFVRSLNSFWQLEARSEQQRRNYENGAFVIRMLASKKGSKNVWQVTSQAARVKSNVDPPLNPASIPSKETLLRLSSNVRKTNRWAYTKHLTRRAPSLEGSGTYYHMFGGGSGQWIRPGHENTNSPNVWHSDDNYVLEPPWVTTLRAVQLPALGGDTVFADMVQAYEDLSDETQFLLCGYRGISDWLQGFPHYEATARANGTDEALEELCRMYPAVAHPLVRTHPQTGKRAVYANAIYTNGIHGFEDTERERELLRDIFALPGIPEYQVRISWRSPGDFLLWDNRVVQHYAVSDYGSSPRKMEHVASLGTRPYLAKEDGTRVESEFVARD